MFVNYFEFYSHKMKKINILGLIFVGLIFSQLLSCKKPDEKIIINPIVKQGLRLYDIDSNEYASVQIGQQFWMQENLRTSHFANGHLISGLWVYDFDTVAVEDYGLLYSWVMVKDTCRICPDGWHVPTRHEFAVLVEYLGGQKLAGGYLKERGLDHWSGPNEGANNEAKWNGRGSGYFSAVSNLFINRKSIGYWWSSSASSPEKSFLITLDRMSMDVGFSNYPKDFGFSVRCISDSLDLTVVKP